MGIQRIINGTVDMGAYEGPHQGFLLSPKYVTVPEGSTATLHSGTGNGPTGNHRGDGSLRIRGTRTLRLVLDQLFNFNTLNYSISQTVTLVAAGRSRQS